jgi:hypothetical protein
LGGFAKLASDDPLTAVPPELLRTITRHEPYRQQALSDAQLYLSFPTETGLGLEIDLVEPLTLAPFDPWSRSLSPLQFHLSWMRTMTGDVIDRRTEQFHRVVWEDGAWKIAAFWSDEERAVNLAAIEQIKAIWGKRPSLL